MMQNYKININTFNPKKSITSRYSTSNVNSNYYQLITIKYDNLQVGQENYYIVKNGTNSIINKGTIVSYNGIDESGILLVTQTSIRSSDDNILGLTTEDILPEKTSKVLTFNESGYIYAPYIISDIISIDNIREYNIKRLKNERINKLNKIFENE